MLNKFLFFVVILPGLLLAQSSIIFQPSIYYTRGEYSNQENSNIISTYLNVNYNYQYFLVAGYDFIDLKNTNWNYNQSNLVGSFIYWKQDFRFKLSALNLRGEYSDKSMIKPLIDKGNLVSPEFLLGVYPYFYGLGYVYFNQNGSNGIGSHQVYFRSDYYPHYKLLISVISSGIYLTSKEKFLSVEASTYYTPFYYLTIKAGFTIGSRKYYFNPDLLILFNQNQTQLSNYSFQIYYNFYKQLLGILTYQRSNFTNFNINYFSIGIKKDFYLGDL